MRLLRELGSAVDANSIWEIEVARRAGFAPADIVFPGVGKSPAELECAVPLGLKAINVESAGELARVEAIAREAGRPVRVAIRVNPDIDAKSHPHISTGLKINKFGVPVDEARELIALDRRSADGSRSSRSTCTSGSQITSVEPLTKRGGVRRRTGGRARSAPGVALEYVDLGGGLGIAYDDAGCRSRRASTSAALVNESAADRAADRHRTGPLDRRPGRRAGRAGRRPQAAGRDRASSP